MRFLTSLIASFACFLAVPAFAQDAAAPRAPVASPTDPENQLFLDLSTGGRVVIWLRPDVAPKTVERIKLLTRQRFYDGLTFHRVIEGFMAQGGDPKGDGTGGSTLPDLKAEFNYLPHVRGAVSAARAEGNDTANSQFFIVFLPRLQLDQKYTVFGRVLSGMEFVDAIERGEPPANPSRILRAYVAADNPPPYQPQPMTAATAPAPAAPLLVPAPPARPRAAPKPAPRKR